MVEMRVVQLVMKKVSELAQNLASQLGKRSAVQSEQKMGHLLEKWKVASLEKRMVD